MFATVIMLIVLVAFLLIIVILAQNSKGGGISSQFGGAGASQLMGVKKTGDLMENLTWGLAIGLIVLTLSTKFIIPEIGGQEFTSPNIESAKDKIVAPSLDVATPSAEETESLGEELNVTDSAQ
ncbi:preprotein translocase subunit SecG [Reichenbachiella versicolor]|uniref:preprotein translocase subunit SecG n=1 Tax=Reichenbachiella versicolor TaxID=1821036 RepID=UPI000D6DD171|nr:preprotein translocase subunit SecG [Reichenbachiella versicolor]